MDLPYNRVEAFSFDDKLYFTEPLALQAAVEKVVGNPALAAKALEEACRLSPLLARACELGMGRRPAPLDEEPVAAAGAEQTVEPGPPC